MKHKKKMSEDVLQLFANKLELRLLLGMRIHNVFHKKLLEPAPQNAELAKDVELEDDEYVVEEIKDLRKIGSQ